MSDTGPMGLPFRPDILGLLVRWFIGAVAITITGSLAYGELAHKIEAVAGSMDNHNKRLDVMEAHIENLRLSKERRDQREKYVDRNLEEINNSLRQLLERVPVFPDIQPPGYPSQNYNQKRKP